MSRFKSIFPATAVVFTIISASLTTLDAQFPPATDEQRAAGSRVATVKFEPAELFLRRGDSTEVTVSFFDADGQPVEGVNSLFFSARGVGPQFGMMTSPTISLTGNTPGPAQVMVLIRVPEEESSFRGFAGVKQAATLSGTVIEAPAASIEIAAVPYTPYAGTSFKLKTTVMTVLDQVHATASVRWRSENPEVATISGGGVVTGIKPGSTTLVVTTVDDVEAHYPIQIVDNPVTSLEMTASATAARTGDVVHFEARPLDAGGRMVENTAVNYAVTPLDSAGAQIYEDGAFVAEVPGTFRVMAALGALTASAVIDVTTRPEPAAAELVGRGPVPHVATSDLWVFEGQDGRDYVYTGTHANGGGERMFAWDVTDPENPVLTDSVVVNARVVNDVKVSDDASWAIITREGASNRANGIVVLDISNPAHPTILSELTDSLTAGIHNVWINGDVVYAANRGTNAMSNLDRSDPDRDGLGTPCDSCPVDFNPDSADTDEDAAADACDNCPLHPNGGQEDVDVDGVGDACDVCLAIPDPAQSDSDLDGEGDACDLDDGVLFFTNVLPGSVEWQDEIVYDLFNLYRGDLSILLTTGTQYTQDPSGPIAEQFCDEPSNFRSDGFLPAVGQAVHYLVTGEIDGAEITLGTDSSGNPRQNDWPCP